MSIELITQLKKWYFYIGEAYLREAWKHQSHEHRPLINWRERLKHKEEDVVCCLLVSAPID